MSASSDVSVRIFLSGDFRVELASGIDLTPASAKAKGLLALLASSAKGSRSRSWLQSRLWSDRAPEQAAGSLRQCLLQIKKSLGDASDILDTSRQGVALKFSQVEIVVNGDDEFLEGLDVRDNEFEDWLRTERNRRTLPGKKQLFDVPLVRRTPFIRQIVIGCVPDTNTASHMSWLLGTLSDALAQQLRETFSVEVVVGKTIATNVNAWSVLLEGHQLSSSDIGVRMSLTNEDAQIWASNKVATMKGAPQGDHPEFQQLCNQLIEAIGDALFQNSTVELNCPDAMSRRAIRSLFSMRKDDILEADQLFKKAYDIESRGLYLAWRAQSKTISRVQRLTSDCEGEKDEAEALCAKALELEPNNSMVLATVANTMSHIFREHERGYYFAERSVFINPLNPMGWWALSSAAMYSGKKDESLNSAIKANQLALTSPHRFWWDLQVFASSLMSGKHEATLHFAKRCHALNPESRVPIRYLIALYANAGQESDAMDMVQKLSVLEPDFSVDRLIRDRSYPASLLHKDVGIDLEKVASLA